MTPDVVADVGNRRIKWGRCSQNGVAEAVSLPLHDAETWQRQADLWQLRDSATWAIADVNAARRDQLVAWIRGRGNSATVLSEFSRLPLVVKVPNPHAVGMDRLLDAVAVNAVRQPGRPAVVIDAGSAVTVDWVDETGAFAGGAILPGFHLMAAALNDYTALLPMVDVPKKIPSVPGTATVSAIEAGIYWAVVGGAWALVAAYARRFDASPEVFLTGGDAALISAASLGSARLCPLLTLEGIRLAAVAAGP